MRLCIGYPYEPDTCFTRPFETMLALERPRDSFWARGRGWCCARRMNHICEQAIEGGADYILTMDADQIYPSDMIVNLVRHIENGHDCVGVPVPLNIKKPNGLKKLAWNMTKDNPPVQVPIDLENGGFHQVDIVGSGVFMYPTKALEVIPKPWWDEIVDKDGFEHKRGCDFRFCLKLRYIAGLEIWADANIDVKHYLPIEVGVEEAICLRSGKRSVWDGKSDKVVELSA